MAWFVDIDMSEEYVGEYAGRKFNTFFAAPSPCEKAREIVECGRKLGEAGLVSGSEGNVSARCLRGMAITTGGSRLDALLSEDVVIVTDYDPSRSIVFASGAKEPSSESPMHFLIYRQFPDVGAVIHVHHDPTVNEAEAHPGKFNLTEKFAPYGTLELALEVLKALRKGNFVVMRKHGVLAVGRDLDDALQLLLEKVVQ